MPRLAALLLIVLVAPKLSGADDWPRWRGPEATGASSESRLRFDWTDPPPVLWQAQVGTGFSSFAIAGGRVFTLGNADEKDTLFCFDVESGALQWQASFDEPLDPNLFEGGPTSTPLVHDGRVYTFSRQGRACCLDAATGAPVWERNVARELDLNVPGWGFASSPILHEGLLLLNAGSAGLALKPEDGAVVWKSDNSDDAGYATPVIAGPAASPVALILSGKSLNGVEPGSGKLLWQYRWITRYGINAADPLLSGDRLFLSSGYGKGSALLQLSSGEPKELWRSRELRNQLSPGIERADYVYAVDGDADEETALKCLKIETGEVVWSEPDLGSATLIAAGDKLLILSEQGELLAVPASPGGFSPLARMPLLTGKCWTPPALANGLLYARNAAGDVVCVDLRK